MERKEILSINQQGWNKVAPIFYGGTALPRYGPLAATEEELQLIENRPGQAVLELGCGSGHSLAYLAKERGAKELWGLDLAQAQLDFTRELLEQEHLSAQLFLSPMDENPGIPTAHFDLVVAIYSLGWTTDLPRTLALIHSYLKPGGTLVFSWEHPAYSCVSYDPESRQYTLARPYTQQGPELHPSWRGVKIVLQPRTLSTYLNALVDAGLVLERLVESELNLQVAREQDYEPGEWYSVPRAQLVPTTFIVKAMKRISEKAIER